VEHSVEDLIDTEFGESLPTNWMPCSLREGEVSSKALPVRSCDG